MEVDTNSIKRDLKAWNQAVFSNSTLQDSGYNVKIALKFRRLRLELFHTLQLIATS